MKAARRGWRYRGAIGARAAAALAGGYALAALTAFALARLLPLAKLEATVAATLLAYLVPPGVLLWAFLARSAARAWAGIGLVAAGLAAAAWLAGPAA